MSPERWQRVKSLLSEALELAPEQRKEWLREQCDDASLREEITSLLNSYEESGDFMDSPQRDLGPLAAAAATAPALSRSRIGPYRLLEEVGRGGMGTVYKAVRADQPLATPVAIKIVKRGMDHEFVLRRFRNERKILAALNHPHIAHLLDVGSTEDGLPYFVMEFIRGKPILQYADAKSLTTRERLELFLKVCSAVQFAHERKVIHRDIKPSNILVNEESGPKLLDFGIAKILDPDMSTHTLDPTATVLRMMTPEYASPEQVRGDTITLASDVYSLGILLYELLSGHRPYRIKSRSPHEIAQVICEERPDPPSVIVNRTEFITRGNLTAQTISPQSVSITRRTKPSELRRSLTGALDNIVLMAIRKEPHRRYQSVAAMAADIQAYLEGRKVQARRETIFYLAGRGIRRNRTTAIAAGATVAAGLALFAFWSFAIQPWMKARNPQAQLTPFTAFAGDETQPAFSPDGERVAFVWTGENGNNADVYLKPVNGAGIVRITTDRSVDDSPTWSPDGNRLAFIRTGPTGTHIFISRPQAGAIHQQITALFQVRSEAVGRHLSWSPDGNYLAAPDKKNPDEPFHIFAVELRTGHKIQLTNPQRTIIGDSNPIYSPDGKWIAFLRNVSSGVDDVYVVPASGGGSPKRMTEDKRYILGLTWTPDSKSLIFSSNRSGPHTLWRVPLSGGTPVRLPSAGQNATDPVISADGKRLAFAQFYADSNIWKLDLETGRKEKLIGSTQTDTSPQYSRDGKWIAFRSSRSGTNEVWIASAGGGSEQQITTFDNTLSGCPRWSPDGRFLVFDSRPEGQPDIFVIDLHTKQVRRITEQKAEDVVPSWSSDGKWIYFSSSRSGSWQVWKKSSDGKGEAIRVTNSGGFAPIESADGKYIYYAKGRSVAGLWRIRIDGTGEEEVLNELPAEHWGLWSVLKDGAVVYLDKQGISRSVLKLVRGGKTSVVATLDKPPKAADAGLAASPDGRSVLVAQVDQSGSDIQMVDSPDLQ